MCIRDRYQRRVHGIPARRNERIYIKMFTNATDDAIMKSTYRIGASEYDEIKDKISISRLSYESTGGPSNWACNDQGECVLKIYPVPAPKNLSASSVHVNYTVVVASMLEVLSKSRCVNVFSGGRAPPGFFEEIEFACGTGEACTVKVNLANATRTAGLNYHSYIRAQFSDGQTEAVLYYNVKDVQLPTLKLEVKDASDTSSSWWIWMLVVFLLLSLIHI
eukprot:TRINITY_DN9105_c0_g1_i4.p1 TRINITY_DN9105_c0_g1~~TRINITY_DN9105_c0_g1_i4.p1  ORF type:complete len:240 (-),score=56.46 TRINITY_DN9105_c0_g1_i4:7-666(-)